MAFDPNIPADYGLFRSADMRAQLNALKALIDVLQAQLAQKTSTDDVLNLVRTFAARNVDTVAQLPPPWSSNPPERDEFNEVRDKVNELVSGLVHPA